MSRQLAFWFDLSCPFAYFASTQIEGAVARAGAELVVRPFLLGGVFRAHGTAQNLASTLSPSKARHNLRDMERQAAAVGAPFAMPGGHPFRTVDALRAILVVAEERGEDHGRGALPLIHALYRAYWVDGVDLGDAHALAGVLAAVSEEDRAGLPASVVLDRARTSAIKDLLRARTESAIALGVFGAPAMVVYGRGPFGDEPEGPQLFWGQDRIGHALAALGVPLPQAPADPGGPPVDVWFDYSSPFGWLGVTRARAWLGPVRWRPMLLGALFKELDGPVVPLHTFSAAKQAWIGKDLHRQAREAGVALRWPSRFPLRTVLALRVTLAVLADPALTDRADALIARLFALCWTEDRDPADPAEVAACCDAVGLPGEALLAAASTAEVKHSLFEATAEAARIGVFGAPTFVVDPEGAAPALYWGNDRLPLVAAERAARR